MKVINRGFDKSLLLLPGWAMDERIFGSLELNYNYIIPEKKLIFEIVDEIADSFKAHASEKISIFGWSMGAFLAQDIFSRWPERVDKVIFVSARKRYDKEKIAAIKEYLKKNKKAYLYSFYQDIFSEDEKGIYLHFKMTLARDYINNFDLELLLEGLRYLESARLRPDVISRANPTFMHGRLDKIAPIDEVLKIQNELPNSKMIVFDDSGHAPFLREDFRLKIA